MGVKSLNQNQVQVLIYFYFTPLFLSQPLPTHPNSLTFLQIFIGMGGDTLH